MQACFDFWLLDLPQFSLYRNVFSLQGMAASMGSSNFVRKCKNGLFELLVIQIKKTDATPIIQTAFLQHVQGRILLIRSIDCSGVGDDSSFGTWLNSMFDVMTINVISFDRTKIRASLSHPSWRLPPETRPTLLEDHLCALRLSRVDPVLNWIFGYTCASSFVWTSPLAVTPVIEKIHLLRVSNSPELKSFLLDICTKAQESITNCRSSGFVEESARNTQASARVKRIL